MALAMAKTIAASARLAEAVQTVGKGGEGCLR